MKKNILLFSLYLMFMQIGNLYSQVLCVKCFNQNDSIAKNLGSHNLLLNGGFENTNCATGCVGVYCPNSSTYNCMLNNWTCTGGGTLTYGCAYDSAHYFVAQGSRAAYFGNSYANACSGNSTSTFPNNDTTCFNKTGCSITGIPNGYPISRPSYGDSLGLSLSQTISGLTIGNNYVLEFWAGGEYEGWFNKPGIFAVNVGYGNVFLGCKITQFHHADTGTRYLIQFKANATSHTINFTSWGHVCGSCTELVLDDVKLYSSTYLPVGFTDCGNGNSGIIGFEKLKATIEPNPAQNNLHVLLNSNEKAAINIFDLTGKKVYQQNFIQSTDIDLSAFEKGFYLYQISNTSGISEGKFIKE